MITDPNGTTEWANPAFTVLTGYPVAERLASIPGCCALASTTGLFMR
ncbi:hypothetical protein [Chloroflexus sp.]|nr:hypothetical protein [Chloroflexus sp.]